MGKRPPVGELLSLFRAAVAREGVTTGAGAAAGTSIIDAGLIGIGANSFISMLMVVYPGDFQNVDSMDITAFNNATGEVTFDTAYKGVAAAIPAGVPYKIITFRFVPAEVAELLTRVGWEGATSLADKLTAARAALLDNLDAAISSRAPSATALSTAVWTNALATALANYTAARAAYLDELAAANIPADIDGLKTSRDRQLFRMVKWSGNTVRVQIDAAGATVNMPTITVANLPSGAVIVEAHLMFKYRMIENKYVGVNKLNGATVAATSQVFQIQDDGGGGWADGINYVDDYHTLADSAREGGDVDVGEPNVGVAGVVDGNDTYNVRLLLGKADQDFINFDDCQVGLDIYYSV